MMQLTGIILAGGKSLRMGQDKALMEIGEKTLLQNAIEICSQFCAHLLISSGNPDYKKFGYETIPDEIENCGPIGGIYTGLKKSETEWNLVFSVDAPFVNADFISFLISEITGFDAVVPTHKNGKEPLIAMYHKNCLPRIRKMIHTGSYKLHDLLDHIHVNYINSEYWLNQFPNLFTNLNQKEDLNKIVRD